MTGQYLFNRAYSVTLSDPQGSVGQVFGNIHATMSALRVNLDIKQGVKSTPDSAKVGLYNLNSTTRAAVCAGYGLRVSAGYQGFCDTLFIGTASKVITERQGPDIVTTIEATDGQQALLNAAFNQKYPKATRLCDILADVVEAMGIEPGVIIGLPDYQLSRSRTFVGGCRQVLEACLSRYGIEFSVRNNKLNMIPRARHLGRAAVVVSPQSGMIGVVSFSGTDGVKFTSLLNPKLVPGQLVQIVTNNVRANGFYKITSAVFEGDSHDQKWTTSVECAKLVGDVAQALTPAQGLDFAAATVPGLM